MFKLAYLKHFDSQWWPSTIRCAFLRKCPHQKEWTHREATLDVPSLTTPWCTSTAYLPLASNLHLERKKLGSWYTSPDTNGHHLNLSNWGCLSRHVSNFISLSCASNLVALNTVLLWLRVLNFFCKERKILVVWSLATCFKWVKNFLVAKIIFYWHLGWPWCSSANQLAYPLLWEVACLGSHRSSV